MNQHLFFLSFLTCPLLFGCTEEFPDNQKDRTRVNAPVFKKIHQGVNIDTSVPQNGVCFKVQHDAAHFRAAAEAGFQSVRVFMPYYGDIKSKEAQIVEALDNDLAIVVGIRSSKFSFQIPAVANEIAKKHNNTQINFLTISFLIFSYISAQ